MEKTTDHFNTELQARIAGLESDLARYANARNAVKRNNGSRRFRKVIGILLEITAYLATLTCPFIIFLLGVAEANVMLELEDHLIGYEPHVVSLVNNTFFAMQLLVAVIMLFTFFAAYLLTKIRRRNNTVRDLTAIVEHAYHSTDENLKRTRRIQLDLMEWVVSRSAAARKDEVKQ